MSRSKFLRTAALVALAPLLATGCLRAHVQALASDEMEGRRAGTVGGAAARTYVIDELSKWTAGPVPGVSGRYAYMQPFPQGVNVLGYVLGTEHPEEVVVVGAHYDHLGLCGDHAADLVCNGATDNATGVAILLDLAQRLSEDPPKRSVMFAFWDSEENGIAGSRYYAQHPLFPLDDIVTYVNVDLVGANLLPSLANTSFAVGAETGGPALTAVVDDAIATTPLGTEQLSVVFGAGRSDHVAFQDEQVPVVYFSDSTGGCYHTPDDEIDKVDFGKLEHQATTVTATVEALAAGSVTPTFRTTPMVTYADAVGLLGVVERAEDDLHLFPAPARATITTNRARLVQIRNDGAAAFGNDDVSFVLTAALTFVGYLADLPCNGHLAP